MVASNRLRVGVRVSDRRLGGASIESPSREPVVLDLLTGAPSFESARVGRRIGRQPFAPGLALVGDSGGSRSFREVERRYVKTGATPRRSRRGYAPYTPLRDRKLQYSRRRTVSQANRVKYQSGAPGPLPADTDDSTPAGGKPAGEYVVRTRSSSSQYPSPSLETGGNARANEGATAYQSPPRSRLSTPPKRFGGVRSMARPVSGPPFRRTRTHSFGRSPLLRSGDRACVEPQAGEFPMDWRRHAPTAPTWCSRTRYSRQGGSAFRVASDRPTPYGGILALQRGEDVNRTDPGYRCRSYRRYELHNDIPNRIRRPSVPDPAKNASLPAPTGSLSSPRCRSSGRRTPRPASDTPRRRSSPRRRARRSRRTPDRSRRRRGSPGRRT